MYRLLQSRIILHTIHLMHQPYLELCIVDIPKVPPIENLGSTPGTFLPTYVARFRHLLAMWKSSQTLETY